VVECLDLKRLNSRNNRRNRENGNNNAVVAIKIVRNVKRYYESALIEADIVEDVNRRGGRGISHCAIMYDAFSFSGHYCMVFERLGPSLYDFQKRQKYRPFPLMCVRDFAKQLLETLEFLHGFRLIHTDLKPENILLLNDREVTYKGRTIPECTRIKVIDFGGATYDNEKKSSVVNTRQYRAPEVILGVGWSMPSDLWSIGKAGRKIFCFVCLFLGFWCIWKIKLNHHSTFRRPSSQPFALQSIGCILAELYQGELLFATHDNIEHLALVEQVVGPFPRRMLKRAKNTQLVDEAFDSMGAHRMERALPPESLAYVKRIGSLESLTRGADTWFLRMLRRILVTDPDERASARECLRKL
jgi:serine/threonine protein kinase